MKLCGLTALTFVALGLAAPLQAGQVKLEIRNGRITLDARDASVREILAEWSRVGQTRILNAERIPLSAPMTIQLTDVPEAKALDIVLRSVAGYVAAPRAVPLETASQFDRIAVMAVARPAAAAGTAATPPAPTATRTPTPPPFGPDRRGRMGGPPLPSVVADDDEDGANQPGQGAAGQPYPGMAAPGQVVGTPVQNPYGVTAQPIGQPATAAPGGAPQSAPRPGMVTAPPPKPPGAPERP